MKLKNEPQPAKKESPQDTKNDYSTPSLCSVVEPTKIPEGLRAKRFEPNTPRNYQSFQVRKEIARKRRSQERAKVASTVLDSHESIPTADSRRRLAQSDRDD